MQQRSLVEFPANVLARSCDSSPHLGVDFVLGHVGECGPTIKQSLSAISPIVTGLRLIGCRHRFHSSIPTAGTSRLSIELFYRSQTGMGVEYGNKFKCLYDCFLGPRVANALLPT